MANFYLIKNDVGRVIGSQITKGEVVNPDYVSVTEQTYNQFTQVGRYEVATLDTMQKMIIAPDPRPTLTITAPLQRLTGTGIELTISKTAIDVVKDTFELLEYHRPDGRVGIVRLLLKDGRATCTIPCDVSGYYRIEENDRYRLNPVVITVYDE